MMPTLHLVALGLYGLAAALALAPFAGLPSLSRRWSVALPGAGALAHGMALAQLTPAGLAPILSLLAVFLIVLQLCCELLLRATAVALFTAPLAAGLVGVALPLGLAAGVEAAAGSTVWFVLHGPLSVFAIALLALAFVSAALYLLQFRDLQTKPFGPGGESLHGAARGARALRPRGARGAAGPGAGAARGRGRGCPALHLQPHGVLPRAAGRHRGGGRVGAVVRAPRWRRRGPGIRIRAARPRRRAPPLPRFRGARLDDPGGVPDPGSGA